MNDSSLNVVWRPLPGSQALALACPAHHILYEGSRGPGKTDAQLMMFRRYVGLGYGQHWRGVIFDREYKNLDDIVAKSLRWFPQFNDGAKFLQSKGDYRWVWPTGEALFFRQIKRKSDYWNYHGQEFPFVGWNELTKYPTPELYDLMMSCNRTSFHKDAHSPPGVKLPDMRLIVFATSNPYGPGHNWVKSRFIDPMEPGEVHTTTIDVFNPRTQSRQKVHKHRARIFGSYKENIYLTPEYVAELESITDPNRKRAWLGGDWDIVAGGALDDVWNRTVHVVPRFKVPASWYVDRSFDWGSTRPFSVGFWAEANGEEVKLPDGKVFCPRKGSLIRFDEWYGTRTLGSNEGLKLSARDIACGILTRETILRRDGWLSGRVNPGPADSSIFTPSESSEESIAKKMEDIGVGWLPSDKSPGSRKNGLQLLRDRLEASVDGEGPGLYFMNNCAATFTLLPVLPRCPKDPDDVDTEAEDHLYDDVRYRVLASQNRAPANINVSFGR